MTATPVFFLSGPSLTISHLFPRQSSFSSFEQPAIVPCPCPCTPILYFRTYTSLIKSRSSPPCNVTPSASRCLPLCHFDCLSPLRETSSAPSNPVVALSAVLLAFSVLLAPTGLAHASLARSPAASAATEAKIDRQLLEDRSRENTRLTGVVAAGFKRAKRAAERGNLREAEQIYTELIDGEGKSCAPLYSNRGNLRVATKRYREALSDYDAALELAPLAKEAWVVYVNRGATRLAVEGVSPTEALADMNRALELKGGDSLVWSNRAMVYEALGRWDAAVGDYQRAVERSPNDVEPFWLSYALALHQTGKSYEALAILKRVAVKFGDRPEINAAMAAVHYDRGELAEAETRWSLIDRPKQYESRSFLAKERRWPPRALDAMERFKNLAD